MFKKIICGLVLLSLALFGVIAVSAKSSDADKITKKNYTDSIKITIDESSNKIKLKYEIQETFVNPSRGVFLSLPKNQNGVWTDYQVMSVTRDDPLDKIIIPENYENFLEWDQFRFRIGNEDKLLEQGTYNYQIILEATKNSDYKYNFVLIRDWQEKINAISVIQNDQELCGDTIDCSYTNVNYSVNTSKPKINPLYFWFFLSAPYFLILSISAFLGFLIYKFLSFGSTINYRPTSPDYEVPNNLLPWEAAFILKDGNLDLKQTLLSYILWQSYRQKLKIIPTNNANNEPDIRLEELSSLNKPPSDDYLPTFDNVIACIYSKNLKDGVYESHFGNHNETSQNFKQILSKVERFYVRKPNMESIVYALFSVAALWFIIISCWFVFTSNVLIGNSYILLFILLTICISVLIVLPTFFWTKLSPEGMQIKNAILRYRFYLNNVEKLKLDFSNNPEEGVQYYLKNVPYAAAFGILDKFNKHFQELDIFHAQEQGSLKLGVAWTTLNYYYASNSYSGGGSSGGGSSGGGGSW